jgi:hypothetical protein
LFEDTNPELTNRYGPDDNDSDGMGEGTDEYGLEWDDLFCEDDD